MRVLIILSVFAGLGFYACGADGFGQNTTGGQEGKVVTISDDAAAFKNYAETADTAYIIQVAGTVDLSAVGGAVEICSNKTIQGIGEKPTIIGNLGFENGSSNVIIERLNITNPKGAGEGDGLSIKENITDVFVTHCTFYDCSDGCMDITRQSDNITVSWCKFYFTEPRPQNNRVILTGNSDKTTEDEGKLHITMHHNWFGANCWQRIPSVRFGRVHLYNNYYDCEGNLYCIWGRIRSECLIENNVFRNVKDPLSIHVEENEAAGDKGKINARGNVFENCTGQMDEIKDTVFTPTYTYTADEAAKTAEQVKAGAGADGK